MYGVNHMTSNRMLPIKAHYDRGHIVGYVSNPKLGPIDKAISIFNDVVKSTLLKLKGRDTMSGTEIINNISNKLYSDYLGSEYLHYYINTRLSDRIRSCYLGEKLSKSKKLYDNIDDRFNYVKSVCISKFEYNYDVIYNKLQSYDEDAAFKVAFRKTHHRGLRNKKQVKAIKEIMCSDGYFEDESDDLLDSILSDKCSKEIRNYYRRRKRFTKKSEFKNINNFNYFCTFTCDDKKCSLADFKAKIRKALENYSTRYGWKIMGVYEYGDQGIAKADCDECEGRIHLHALINIPYGKMNGELFEISNYSYKKQAPQVTINHPFFYQSFGICDFKQINVTDNLLTTYVDYICKYIMKSGERVMYSRGIITDTELVVDEADIIGVMNDHTQKITLYDDCSIILIDNAPFLKTPLSA